jgi:DNA-directed RNA polymerase specialized sigma24 family protein
MSPTALATRAPAVSDGCRGFITDLVLRCGRGDESALAKLFDLTYFVVLSMVRPGAAPTTGIDDEVVAAFVRIWRYAPSYRPADRQVLAWIFDRVVDDRY